MVFYYLIDTRSSTLWRALSVGEAQLQFCGLRYVPYNLAPKSCVSLLVSVGNSRWLIKWVYCDQKLEKVFAIKNVFAKVAVLKLQEKRLGLGRALVHQQLGFDYFDPSWAREVRRMVLCSAAVSRESIHGFPPPLNPIVKNKTCTLRTDTDRNESWSSIKTIHTRKTYNRP